MNFGGIRANNVRIWLFGAKAPNHGIAAVSVDGGPETLVDLYAPTRSDNELLFSSTVLPAGAAHTLRVRVTGTKNSASTGGYVPADRVEVRTS